MKKVVALVWRVVEPQLISPASLLLEPTEKWQDKASEAIQKGERYWTNISSGINFGGREGGTKEREEKNKLPP